MRIEAGNTNLDIDNDETVAITFAINDILDLSKQKTSFTKTIKLMGTNNNNSFFNYNFDVNIDNKFFNINKSIKCKLYKDDIELLSGNLKLNNITITENIVEYEVMIVGHLFNIYTKLKGLDIKDLDFSNLNHVRTRGNIVSSFSNKADDGYIYPYIIYGDRDDIADYSIVRDWRPAVFVKYIFDKMIDKVGYTYKSDFINSDYFKSIIMPYTSDKIKIKDTDLTSRVISATVKGDYTVNSTNYSFTNNTLFNQGDTNPFSETQFNINTIPIESYNLDLDIQSGSIGGVTYRDDLDQLNNLGITTIQNSGYYNIDFDAALYPYIDAPEDHQYIQKDNGNYYYYKASILQVKPDGTVIILDDTSDSINTSGWVDFFFDNDNGNAPYCDPQTIYTDSSIDLSTSLTKQNVYLEDGDKIYLSIGLKIGQDIKWKQTGTSGFNNTVGVNLAIVDVFSSNKTHFNVQSADNEAGENYEIDFNSIIDEYKLTDFLKDISAMFKLIIHEEENNVLLIEPIDDYYKSKQKILNWNELVDRNKPIKITPLNNVDFNEYQFLYKKDSDWLNDEYTTATDDIYGSKYINVENDFSNKKLKYQLNVSASPVTDLFIKDRVAPFFCTVRNDSELSPRKNNKRFLFVNEVECELFKLYDALNKVGINNGNDGAYRSNLYTYPYCGMYNHPIYPKYSLNFELQSIEYNKKLLQVSNDNLYKFHRTTIKSIIDVNARILELDVYLTELDINTFDFRDIIFVDESYWRVDSIIDFKPGVDTTTKVKLVKIIDIDDFAVIKSNLPTNNSSCPSDLTLNHSTNVWESPSGQAVTLDCCNSVGGDYINSVCHGRTSTTTDDNNSSNRVISPNTSLPSSRKRNNKIASESGKVLMGNVTSDVTTSKVSNSDVSNSKTSNSDTVNTNKISFNNGVSTSTKVINIGVWKMHKDANKIIPHGLSSTEWSRITSIKVTITNNDKTNLYILDNDDNGGVDNVDESVITLWRLKRGVFDDSSNFNDKSDRGYITITYIPD